MGVPYTSFIFQLRSNNGLIYGGPNSLVFGLDVTFDEP